MTKTKAKYYLVTYSERTGEEENSGKFLVFTADVDKAIDEVLSDFYGNGTYKDKPLGDGYWRRDGCAVVRDRGSHSITSADAKVLIKHGTNILWED